MNNSLKTVINLLHCHQNKKQAQILRGFFKTDPGEYGEGDIFIGVRVPQIRALAKTAIDLSLPDLKKLIKSKIHEERLLALIVLTYQFDRAREVEQTKICNFYLCNTCHINNWDLVDLSAPKILGSYLLNRPKGMIFKLANSRSLWERRIAIVATHAFIANNQYTTTLNVAKILLKDKEDLIHKAVGWMLREVGKKNRKVLIDFLTSHYTKVPRTTLRYAIERFPEQQRKAFLLGRYSGFQK